MTNLIRSLIASLGGWIGLVIGYLTRPNVELGGMKIPLNTLFSSDPSDARYRNELLLHCFLAASIGAVVAGLLSVFLIRRSRFGEAVTHPGLDVGRAVSTTWRVFRRQPWRYVWLVLIPILITIAVQLVEALIQIAVRSAAGAGSVTAIIVVLLIALVSLVVRQGAQIVCQIAGQWATARNMEGGLFTTTAALAVGFGRILPYFGILILALVIFVVGFFPVLVPGIIASGYLAVAAPACVLERLGPIRSIKRSAWLVAENWWRCLATVVLTILLPVLVFAVASLLIYLLFAAIGIPLLALLLVLPGIAFFLVLAAVATILPAVLFVELRALKEGRAQGTLAGVFE